MSTTRELVLAVIAGEIMAVRALHAAGVPVTEPDGFGWLPIHRAAANDRDELIRHLLEWGSPLEATGTQEWTPSHLAAVSRSSRAVTALLRAGANLHAPDARGRTPLHLAVGPTVTRSCWRRCECSWQPERIPRSGTTTEQRHRTRPVRQAIQSFRRFLSGRPSSPASDAQAPTSDGATLRECSCSALG